MADFCWDCVAQMFDIPSEKNDLRGLTTPEDTKKGLYAQAICEGCGFVLVDHTGKVVQKLNTKGTEDGNAT